VSRCAQQLGHRHDAQAATAQLRQDDRQDRDRAWAALGQVVGEHDRSGPDPVEDEPRRGAARVSRPGAAMSIAMSQPIRRRPAAATAALTRRSK